MLLKESSKLFYKSNYYKKNNTYKFKFIYFSDLKDDINIEDTINNNYLKQLHPIYTYRNYYTCYLKIPRKKRLVAEGFVFNNEDSIICKIQSFHLYPISIDTFIHDNKRLALYNIFINNQFEKVFKIGYFSNDIYWCIKNNKTYIYNTEKQTLYLLSDFYNCCWNLYNRNEIQLKSIKSKIIFSNN